MIPNFIYEAWGNQFATELVIGLSLRYKDLYIPMSLSLNSDITQGVFVHPKKNPSEIYYPVISLWMAIS